VSTGDDGREAPRRRGRGDAIVLDNGRLRVTAESFGAELGSLKRSDAPEEYLWQGDPAWWNRRAPVLFPIVGRLRDDRYTWRGESFSLGQHGFARDRRFTLVGHDALSARFELRDDADTRAAYPFAFRLAIEHRLDGESLRSVYEVTNSGGDELPFSLGAHPGLRCPLIEGEVFEDHVVEFEREETADRHLVVDGLIDRLSEPLLRRERSLPLRRDHYTRGALVATALESRRATLRSQRSGRGVELSYPGFPFFGIWTKPGAPFVCLEPWCGIADRIDASGRLEDKAGLIRLAPGATFRREITLRPF